MRERNAKRIPELRFPEFGRDWQSKSLDQIGNFKNGFNADKEAFGTGSEFINLMDIFGKSYIQKTYLDRVEVDEKHLDQYKIQKGDVLFVRSSVKREGVGQSCLVDDAFEDTVYSGFIIRFREKSRVLFHSYKKYCFSSPSFRKKVLALATSSANTNINQDSLSQIQLFYPSVSEQEKIASFLEAIASKIDQLRRRHELLQTYKRGVMQKLFSQEIRFKQDDGSDFPDWEKTTLGQTSTFFNNERIPLSTEERNLRQGIYPYYGASGVIDSVDDYIFDGSYILLAEDGANIITRSTPIALLAEGKFWVNNHAHVLKSKGSNKFLVEYLESIRYEKYNTGTAQPKLNAEVCKNISVDIPLIDEQEKIALLLSIIDQKLKDISQQISYIERFKSGLLQKMFV